MTIVNIAAALVERARQQPDAIAQVEPTPGLGAWERKRTFRQLDDESDRLARGLARLGVRRGMRTVLMVPPSLDFYALTFALFKLGAVVVLIDPGMGVRGLGRCLNEAEPEAFVGVTKAHVARILLGWGRKTIRHNVTVGFRLFWGGWTLGRAQREGEKGEPVLEPTVGDEMAAILFTSGSTGVAKGAVYTHSIFAAQVEYLKSMYGIEPGEVDLPTFPLFGLFAPALGMTAVIPHMDFTRPGKVNPQAILAPIPHCGVTNLFGSPALLRRVGFDRDAASTDLRTLRRVISAGAPVPAKVIRQITSLLPPGVQVHTPYGATEALPVSSIGSDEVLGETGEATARGKGVCVGRPVDGMTVRIIRIDDSPIPRWNDDLELPAGQIGEIVVQGPVVTRSYYNRPDATALHKIEGASGSFWHRMGDLGYLDEKGRIWFCGRKSQRVVTARGVMFTIPCEGVFNAHPLVLRSALVGARRGSMTVPVICIELDRSNQAARKTRALVHELTALAEAHEHTRPIRQFLIHPGFPVDIRHNAKIFREKLTEWATDQIEQELTGGRDEDEL
jgi:acyl-CoA synthetase (AMP-forming)/AMP-acid ligase II